MLNANQEIVELYEQGLDVAAIAEETGYDAVAVKAVLLQGSKRFRIENKFAPTEKKLITDEEDEELIAALKDIGLRGEVEAVRARTLMYLHDEHKGRNDRNTKGGNLQVSILMLNDALKNSRKQVEDTKSIIVDAEVVS